jgi:hypothetical protein
LLSALGRIQNQTTAEQLAFELVGNLQKSLSEKFLRFEQNSILAKPTFLDPRFKKSFAENEQAYTKVKTEVQNEMMNILRNDSRTPDSAPAPHADDPNNETPDEDNIWFDIDQQRSSITVTPTSSATIELRQYIEEAVIPRESDPLEWWKIREILYPTLAKLAKKYLCITATSVPSERIFSKSGQIISEKRSRLSPKLVEKMLFLNANKHLF